MMPTFTPGNLLESLGVLLAIFLVASALLALTNKEP
jgi:hypothetical protein